MIELPGNRIIGLPLGELKLISELMEFDGNPMILHFVNAKNEDIIAYWVDYDSSAIRWMYVKVTKKDLFLYLIGKVSLKTTLENIQTEYIFFIDVPAASQTARASMITRFEIPEKYMPKEDSFFVDGLSDEYADYLSEIQFDLNLRERSYIVKGEPSDASHGKFLPAKEGAAVLESIAQSANAYVFITAKNKYRHKYASETRVNKVSKDLKDRLTPLISHAAIGSFEVWLAMDTITLNDLDEIGSQIKSEIVEGYKRDVLDVDFTSEHDAKIICEKYDAVERKKIYGPIIDMLENENVNITVSDKLRTIRETGKPLKTGPAFTDIVIPKPTLEEILQETERQKRIYTLVLSLKEGTDISRISKKDILDNLLLFENDIEVPYPIQSPIEVADESFILKKPIIATLKITDGDNLEISNADFSIDVKGKDIAVLNGEAKRQFLDFITPYIEGTKTNSVTLLMLSEYLDLEKYK